MFLPISKKDMSARGWTECDFVYVIGDAYVDHPSFGHAIISRVLEHAGYRVGIISQPDWKDPESIAILGYPRLGFLVMGGNMDSMVNHYSVFKHRRKTDAFTPGGKTGKRPDYATVVYCNLIRQKFKDAPIIIGGMEASLRRLAHYDYWSDRMKRSILLDSQADLLLYGMGERSIVEVADALNSGLSVHDLTFLDGTVYKSRTTDQVVDGIVLPDWETVRDDKAAYARSFDVQYRNTDPFVAKPLIEQYGRNYVIQNPPQKPLTQDEMDLTYDLPYENTYHPSYEKLGGVPAIQEVKFSLTSCRGCFGGCSFCAITFHQGRIIQTRSQESILREAVRMTKDPDFKGYIHDVGGPTANFRLPSCQKQLTKGVCPGKQCLFPKPCRNLRADHSDYVDLLRKLRALPGVKKVFIRSGIRFDYLLADKDDTFFRELVKYHVSGQLRVAPEHVSDRVLRLMGKPENAVYRRFLAKYEKINRELGLDQYAVPYLMSSHPGSRLEDAIELAEHIRDLGYMPEQVQDFYPTPSTISTVMYWTGLDPRTMEPVYVPTDPREKAMQRALIQYRDPKNYRLVYEALKLARREDLIGNGPKCLIRAPKNEPGATAKKEPTKIERSAPAKKEPQRKARSASIEKGPQRKAHSAQAKKDVPKKAPSAASAKKNPPVKQPGARKKRRT
ncbi:MAG: YgiQ family radical SAM protein [Oscillospiraceae bacterium]|nr:YgiQ family radical SAM protein [Oscillospiraceae bacterium]